jgi:hypothetical protein
LILVASCSDGTTASKDAAAGGLAADGAVPPVAPDAGPEATVLVDAAPGCQNGCDAASVAPEVGDGSVDLAQFDAGANVDVAQGEVETGGWLDAAADTSSVADSGGDVDVGICERACAVVAMVTCPGARPCLPDCLASLEGKCGAAASALQTCVGGRHASDFSCTNDGAMNEISLSDEVCASERGAFALCVLSP